MQIAAVGKMTLLDYPRKVSAIVFTPGCNLRCDFCHNPEFVLPNRIEELRETIIPEESFFRFLETRKGFLDGVVVCGGEPTLQKDLPEFLAKIKEMGFLVKLDTNGTRPEILKSLYRADLLDYVAMDIKHVSGRENELSGINMPKELYQESIRLIMESGRDYEFRTTLTKPFHTASDVEEIAQSISGARNYYLQNYRAGNTLKEDFSGLSFLNEELLGFKAIAEKYVEHCGVRL